MVRDRTRFDNIVASGVGRQQGSNTLNFCMPDSGPYIPPPKINFGVMDFALLHTLNFFFLI
jgi:hypothetical protein